MKLWHRHTWVEVSRKFGVVNGWGSMRGFKQDTTLITYQCECEKYKQDQLIGWIAKDV